METFTSAETKCLRSLAGGVELNQTELAQAAGVTTRHLRRVLASLKKKGSGLVERKDGGMVKYCLPAAEEPVEGAADLRAFTEKEVFALLFAASAASALLEPTPLGKSLQGAYEKLTANVQDRVYTFEPETHSRRWFFESPAQNLLNAECFEALLAALIDQRTVSADYHSGRYDKTETNLLLDPYLLSARGTSWLLTGLCHETKKIRDFSLAGFLAVRPTAQRFDAPRDFDPNLHFRDRFSALEGGEVHTVRLRVRPDRAVYFKRKQYHPTQQIEGLTGDGRTVVSFEVSGLEEIAAFIRSWGPGVEVTEPEALRARMLAQAQALVEMYAGSDVPV